MKIRLKNRITEEVSEKLQFVRVCIDCNVFGQDMVMWKKRRCPLCSSLTKRVKFVTRLEAKEEKKAIKADASTNANSIPVSKLKDETMLKIVKMIVNRTRDFDCPGEVNTVIKGPVVTEYEFTPDKFTRIKKLKSLNEDLALGLSVDTVSIRRIHGRPVIGIQIPNADRVKVSFADCLPNIVEPAKKMFLPLNFGILSDGSPFVEDLTSYPHMLLGGSTGAGKSVLLHQLISNLLTVRSPDQLKLVLIDPKMVELFSYKSIPHIMPEMPPVHRIYQVADVMSELIKIMKDRTEVMHDYKVVDIKEFNAKHIVKAKELKKDGRKDWAKEEMKKCWPYIVMVIDEMSEIVLQEKKTFINNLASLSQMARAAGISIISSTQRPSTDVLPGKIKVNFLARASLKVPAQQDSKTILNEKGAETLLGKGDLFLRSPDQSSLLRIHVPFCQAEDRDAIIKRSIECGYDDNGTLLDFDNKKKAKNDE